MAIFTNSTGLTIPDSPSSGVYSPATQTLNVSGVGVVTSLRISLNGLTHTFPGDLDMMLVAPDGTNLIFLSDVGGGNPGVTNVNLVISDYANTNSLPLFLNAANGYALTSGTYRPTNNTTDVAAEFPSVATPYNLAANTAFTSPLAHFNGVNANGTWTLIVTDDANVDTGALTSWSLDFNSETIGPAVVTAINPILTSLTTNVEGTVGTALRNVVITRLGDFSSALTVDYTTADGTATGGASAAAGVDYISKSGTLSFAAGEQSQVVQIGYVGDTTPEPDETFFINFSNPSFGTSLNAPITIVNDEAGWNIYSVTKAEGNAGTTAFTFTVNRGTSSTPAATINYATSDGTATAASGDYTAASGTLSFASGQLSSTFTVLVTGDTAVETDESFTVTLSGASTGAIITASATGTITNDDTASPAAPPPVEAPAAPPAPPPSKAPVINADFTNLLRYASSAVNPLPATVTTPDGKVLPNPLLEQQKAVQALIAKVDAGTLTQQQALDVIVDMADGTTSVATMSYQFFTHRLPTRDGLDYLTNSPLNPNDINDGYYAGMSLENRYINFAVNLGKLGEGRADFQANYGGLSLADATAKAYAEIFGKTADAAKVAAILTPERAGYFLSLGGDALGQKAAMVGFLLGEAAKADAGPYAVANENFLYDLADGTAAFGANAGIYLDAGPTHVALVGVAEGG